MPDVPEYDKEGWWAECLKVKPDLSRKHFEALWMHLWVLGRMTGQVRRKK